MGDIADMMLEGTLCAGCGEYLGADDLGCPQYCAACASDNEDDGMGGDFRIMRRANQVSRQQRLEAADPTGWKQHTQYHWSRMINGKQLDYWPSKSKFRYDNKTVTGDVDKFIKARTNP